MNYISIFFLIRFLFYIFLSDKLSYSFGVLDNLGKIDNVLAGIFSLVIAANFARAGINIKRARILILVPPFILLSPVILLILPTFVLGQWKDLLEIILNTTDFLLLLLTISFSILIPTEILYNLKKTNKIIFYTLISFTFGIVGFIVDDNILSGFLKMTPFLYGSYLATSKK